MVRVVRIRVMAGVEAAVAAGPGIPRKLPVAPLNFHVVRSLQGQAGLMMGKDLKLDLVGGVGQELGGLGQCTVLHAGSVDGQDMIPPRAGHRICLQYLQI